MPFKVREQQLGDIPWLVLEGTRPQVMVELGRRHADSIRFMVSESPMADSLRRVLHQPETRAWFDEASASTRKVCAVEWLELALLAEGAGVLLDDILRLNLRGDVGVVDWEGGLGGIDALDATGCTDISLVNDGGWVLAHSEDGAEELDGRCILLTLCLDDEIPVTTWWYPGFLPSNTFGVNGRGVVWGIDNVRRAVPGPGPGRHFAARRAQRAHTPEAYVAALYATGSAGAFAYNVGAVGTDRIVQVEVAGDVVERSVDRSHPGLLWHTNHLRYLPPLDVPTDESRGRAEVAESWSPPDDDPVTWCLDVLLGQGAPRGVRRDAAGDDDLVTLAAMVAELRSGTVVVAPRHGQAVAIPADALARGDDSEQQLV